MEQHTEEIKIECKEVKDYEEGKKISKISCYIQNLHTVILVLKNKYTSSESLRRH